MAAAPVRRATRGDLPAARRVAVGPVPSGAHRPRPERRTAWHPLRRGRPVARSIDRATDASFDELQENQRAATHASTSVAGQRCERLTEPSPAPAPSPGAGRRVVGGSSPARGRSPRNRGAVEPGRARFHGRAGATGRGPGHRRWRPYVVAPGFQAAPGLPRLTTDGSALFRLWSDGRTTVVQHHENGSVGACDVAGAPAVAFVTTTRSRFAGMAGGDPGGMPTTLRRCRALAGTHRTTPTSSTTSSAPPSRRSSSIPASWTA